MALEITVRNDKDQLKMTLKGRFDFESNRDFRRAYEDELKGTGNGTVEIDLGGVDYMDSSALGMLLLLKERAETKKRSVSLVNCHGTVLQILEVVNFKKMFSIRG